MDILDIINENREAQVVISDLKKKSINVPSWAILRKEYDPKLHPVMTDRNYRDKYNKKTGQWEKVTRTTLG